MLKRRFILIYLKKISDAGRHQEKDQHYHRYYKTDHKAVQAGTTKMFPVSFHLADNIFRTDHPAHQNTGKEGDKRHQEAVADIIHYIQQLCSGTIWKWQFKVQCIISKTDQYSCDK